MNQLQAINNSLAGTYCLANDIDASTKPNFEPIGDVSTPFTGSLNGNGHVVSNLTIKSTRQYVGLFSVTNGAVVQNLTLANIDVRASPNFAVAVAGAVAGSSSANPQDTTTFANVHVSGQVRCLTANCDTGGLFGGLAGSGIVVVRNSSTSAKVVGSRFVGGAAGLVSGATIRRTYATGAVTCTGANCMAGGLLGRSAGASLLYTFATGPVTVGGSNGDSRGGGLIAYCEASTTIARSYATGSVTGGVAGFVGGLTAQLNGGSADQTYAIGAVSSTGATARGLIANVSTGTTVTNSYWDTETTGQATSGAGTGMTTAQLRAAVPAGFNSPWSINQTLSYPFLTLPDIDFVSPLATLVRASNVFTFLPISQRDDWEFSTPPAHSYLTSLAVAYTMIARAVGIAENVPQLKNITVDKYFWDEAAETSRWRGPITNYATLGPLTSIGASDPIEVANVIGLMDAEQLVLLRGKYNRGGTKTTHWMLGTLYTKDGGGNPAALVAHDPFTGQQVTIDLATKQVVTPVDFPLGSFKVDGYRGVSLN